MNEQDLIRREVLNKLLNNTSKKVEEKAQPIVANKEDGISLVEAALKHRLEEGSKDTAEIDTTRGKIIESLDLGMIGRIMDPRT